MTGVGAARPHDVEVRAATDEDWNAIFEIFSAVVEDGRTYAYPEGLASGEARRLWVEPSPARSTVATLGGSVVGCAKMGPNRPGRGSHVATASVMVAPGHRDVGVGRALGADVVAWARDAGYRGIQFNAVVATNSAAVHLWETLGFDVVGRVPGAFEHPVDGYVDLLVMFRSIV